MALRVTHVTLGAVPSSLGQTPQTLIQIQKPSLLDANMLSSSVTSLVSLSTISQHWLIDFLGIPNMTLLEYSLNYSSCTKAELQHFVNARGLT